MHTVTSAHLDRFAVHSVTTGGIETTDASFLLSRQAYRAILVGQMKSVSKQTCPPSAGSIVPKTKELCREVVLIDLILPLKTPDHVMP
jgi:hypothetical protein